MASPAAIKSQLAISDSAPQPANMYPRLPARLLGAAPYFPHNFIKFFTKLI